ncbi:Protein-tyrosine phosphatase [Ostertagia ostertagi]
MKRTNDFNVMTEFVAQIPQGRNRYKDVGCLDYQRVVLNIGPVSYIHANYVSTPISPKRFICTQSSKKSAPYVPITAEESPLNFDGVTVKFKRQEQVHKMDVVKTPIIVHCSAGIGRTGSIVLIEHALELLGTHETLGEIRSLLLALRKQRNNSIQTEHQYLYVHQVLLIYLKKMRYLDESVNPYLEQFTAEYTAATRGF